MNYNIKYPENDGGMNERIKRLRQQSIEMPTTLSIERALIETEFYRKNYGTMPTPVLRARNFYEICQKKTLYIGDDELIVGERGPLPKAVPTFPELTCHSVEDLHTLNGRELQRYTISQEDIDTYAREVIPYWEGRTQRERIFSHVSKEWEEAYHAGVFTEFMEQRAGGHTAMDGKMYQRGLLDCKALIAQTLNELDFINDPEATDKQKTLPVLIVIHDLHPVLIDERRDCLHRNRRILSPDDLFLRNGRIIVHVRFPHDRELDIVPVLRLLERLRIMIHLILPMKPERMKITAEEDQPDIRMLPKKVNILRCNMRTIEVRNIDH